MEEKKQNIVDLIKGFEERIHSNEKLLHGAFSYLYIRQDELANYDKNFTTIDKSIAITNSRIDTIEKYVKEIENNIYDQLALLSSNINNICSTQENKKLRKKRPWHYFISKYFKYRKLCKERELLHEQQRLELEEKLRIQEEERKKAEELRKQKAEQERLERIKKAEQAKLEKEMKRKLARNKMSEILNNIGKE